MSEWPIRLYAPYALRKDGSWVWASCRLDRNTINGRSYPDRPVGEWVPFSQWVIL